MVKKLFIYLFILLIIFLTSISIGHCKTFSYGLKYFDINNTRYPCIQNKTFIRKLINILEIH